MINVAERRERLRRRKAIREGIKNAVFGVLLVIGMLVFMNEALKAWDAEMEAHGEYNREYVQQMRVNQLNTDN